MKIILASGSPRRKDILESHSIYPIIIPSDVDETISDEIEKLGVEEIVKYLASIKASTVHEILANKFNEHKEGVSLLDTREEIEAFDAVNSGERVFVLGADTVVYKDSIIGKPKDAEDAFSILSTLRNTSHHVYTGVSLIDFHSGEETRFVDDTLVYFNDYSDEEIRRFIREEPPYDKSGSYAIQSSWSRNVDRIEGDIENVIGLPFKKIEPYIMSNV